MSDNLLPCPFCGGEAHWDTIVIESANASFREDAESFVGSCLRCSRCGCMTDYEEGNAVELWNRRRRTVPDVPVEAIRSLHDRISGEWYMYTDGIEEDIKAAMATVRAWLDQQEEQSC